MKGKEKRNKNIKIGIKNFLKFFIYFTITFAMATPIEWVVVPGGDIMIPIVWVWIVPNTPNATKKKAKN